MVGSEFWPCDGHVPGDFGEDFSWLIILYVIQIRRQSKFCALAANSAQVQILSFGLKDGRSVTGFFFIMLIYLKTAFPF